MLSKAFGLTGRIARWAVWAGGAMMLFAALMVTFDVLMRRFFGFTIGGADEISGYLFAIATSWAFAYVLLNRGHVRIDAIYLLLPRPVCAALDLFALLVFGLFMVLLAEGAWGVLATSYELSGHSTTPLRTPLVWPQSFWFAGLVLFLVAYVLVLVETVIGVFRRDWDRVRAVSGAPSLDEEVKEELEPGAADHARPGDRKD